MTEQTEITKHTESRTQQGLKLSVCSVISVCCGHLSSGLFFNALGLLTRQACRDSGGDLIYTISLPM